MPAPAPSIRRDGYVALANGIERPLMKAARAIQNRLTGMTGLALVGDTRMSEAETLVILHALAR